MKMLWSALVVPVLASCAVVEPEANEPVPARELVPAPLPENLPDAAARALSSRADGRAEQAALVVDRDRWVASEDTYARVAADFAAIERDLPAVNFGFVNGDAPRGVHGSFVYADDEAVAAANAQALVSVTALAEALGGEVVDADENSFSASWPARLQPEFIREVFSAIDSVQFAFPGVEETQDGPVVEVEQFEVDGKNVWLMLNFGGDCPEGCTELEASRVRVEKVGDALTVDLLGTFSTGEACPEWLAVLQGVCERYAAPTDP
jgi:hypothetical protein